MRRVHEQSFKIMQEDQEKERLKNMLKANLQGSLASLTGEIGHVRMSIAALDHAVGSSPSGQFELFSGYCHRANDEITKATVILQACLRLVDSLD